jgi:hypothetical protein
LPSPAIEACTATDLALNGTLHPQWRLGARTRHAFDRHAQYQRFSSLSSMPHRSS